MAKQITQLPVAASVAASDVFPLDQSGTTKQATLTSIAAGLPAGTGTGGLVRQLNPVFSGGLSTAFNINGVNDSGSIALVAGVSVTPTSGSYIQVCGGTHPTQANKTFFGIGTTSASAIDSSGNWGLGTTTPAARLHVSGGSIRVDNSSSIQFTDASGTSPYIICQGDNNFVLYGTNSAGGLRAILTSIMRSDTEPLNVAVPLRIGSGSSAVQNFYTATFSSYAPPAIPANGGVQFLDVTVTGATTGMVCMVECPGGMSNESIILKANNISPNTVRVYWVNPTAASVTISANNYRIACIKF